MKKKKALIFGITGQDGSYLLRLLLSKNYIVHGVKRKSSSLNTSRIDDIYLNQQKIKKNFFYLHYGDVLDTASIFNLIHKIRPNEIYNLAAQSHVKVSFELPEYTANVDGLGTLRILEVIRRVDKKIKFYQAGTSEMFGDVLETPQNENTPFNPRSPYAISKMFAHWITKNYREAYGIFATNGILFNHESPVRGETFVTKKIIKSLVNIKFKKQDTLILGNLDSKRDWGHAKDYVEAMWLMMQKKNPSDYVIATGKQYSIRYLVNLVCKKLKMKIIWRGSGENEYAVYNKKKNNSCFKKIL